VSGCDACLARAWLLARLAPNLEHLRGRIDSVLGIEDGELIEAVGGEERARIRAEHEAFEPAAARERTDRAGVETICRCDPRYPRRLHDLQAQPAVLHIAGGLERFLALVEGEPVALVGARQASPYGLDLARSLGRGLAVAGVTVLSGMALGVDSAAHAGALAAPGPTVAVLPGGADRAYPAGKRALRRQIVETGAAVSELPPGAQVWRWMFPARNRIIAALAAITIVVEAGERSGALLTARSARALGRPVGAVPGRVTSPMAAGPNALLAAGACLVRGPQDVLDQLFGAGVRQAQLELRAALAPELQELLGAIADGRDTTAALERGGVPAETALAALAALELAGYVRRGPGGRWLAAG
jgi:DNA processing protein